jgi:hypothetical protein
MSEAENPVDTVVRLLNKNMSVVKDDGNPANICVSREWLDRELFKSYDGQVTVGLSESRDTKVELSGRLRRSIGNLRVNVWTTDRLMRNKIVEEIRRIVRQNRNKPNETLYSFAGVGQESETHKAYHISSADEPAPRQTCWIELADEDYAKIWYSDDQRFSEQCLDDGKFSLMLFGFLIESREEVVKKIALAFEGYGVASAGNGVTVKVWNHIVQAWQNAQSGNGDTDETVTISLSSGLSDYIDDDGYIWLLARTTHASNGVAPAILHCDYACCTATVNGLAYLDVTSFRDTDRADVKPFIFHTEFHLNSWSFEDIGA